MTNVDLLQEKEEDTNVRSLKGINQTASNSYNIECCVSYQPFAYSLLPNYPVSELLSTLLTDVGKNPQHFTFNSAYPSTKHTTCPEEALY